MNIGFKGTSIDQDVRFSDKEKRELKKMKFPAEFNEKVDFSKIKLDVIGAWVTKRVTEILGFEDDVVINMVNSYLQSKEVDPKKMQLNLTGFLEKDTASFVTDLWRLLLDAQQNNGVPSVMMDEIKEELRKRKNNSSFYCAMNARRP